MVKIVFYMFDKEKNGDINKNNMVEFLQILHNSKKLKGSLRTALESFEVKRDGTIDFISVVWWCKKFPAILEPAFTFQAKIREIFLGVAFWEKKLLFLQNERNSRDDVREQYRAQEQKRLFRERSRRIRAELGLQYYFNKRKREYIEKLYPVPTVYIEDEEIKVKFSDEEDHT